MKRNAVLLLTRGGDARLTSKIIINDLLYQNTMIIYWLSIIYTVWNWIRLCKRPISMGAQSTS